MKRGQKPIDPSAWKARVAKREGIEWVSEEKSGHRGDHERVVLFHTACQREFAITPNAFKRDRGCTLCGAESRGRTEKRDFDSFQELVDEVHGPGKYLVIGRFERMAEKIEVEHLASDGGCGGRFSPRGDNFTRRAGATTCPHCARGWGQEEFEAAWAASPGTTEYEILAPYTGIHAPLPLRHIGTSASPCGYLWQNATANGFLNVGSRCPNCSATRNSKLQLEVESALLELLEPHGLPLLKERWFPELRGKGGGLLRFDLAVDELRLLVEPDGEFHDRVTNMPSDGPDRLATTVEHDRRKTEWAEANGWSLLRVNWKEHKGLVPATASEFLAPLLARFAAAGRALPAAGGAGGRSSLAPGRQAFAPRQLRADSPTAQESQRGWGGPAPMRREELEARLAAGGSGIRLVGPMVRSTEATDFVCRRGHTVTTSPNNIVNHGGGCGLRPCNLENRAARRAAKEAAAAEGRELPEKGMRWEEFARFLPPLEELEARPPSAAGPRSFPNRTNAVSPEKIAEIEGRMRGELGDGYRLVGPYEGYARPYRLVHLACGREWSPTVTNVMSGQRCPHCRERALATAALPGTTRRIVDLASYVLFCDGAEGCEPGEYVPLGWADSRTKSPMLHRRCGRTYLVAPNLFQGGRRCPHCTPRGRAAARARAEGRMGPPVNRETLKRLAKRAAG